MSARHWNEDRKEAANATAMTNSAPTPEGQTRWSDVVPPAGFEPATPALGVFLGRACDLRKRKLQTGGLGKQSSVVLTCSRGFPSSCVLNPFRAGVRWCREPRPSAGVTGRGRLLGLLYLSAVQPAQIHSELCLMPAARKVPPKGLQEARWTAPRAFPKSSAVIVNSGSADAKPEPAPPGPNLRECDLRAPMVTS